MVWRADRSSRRHNNNQTAAVYCRAAVKVFTPTVVLLRFFSHTHTSDTRRNVALTRVNCDRSDLMLMLKPLFILCNFRYNRYRCAMKLLLIGIITNFLIYAWCGALNDYLQKNIWPKNYSPSSLFAVSVFAESLFVNQKLWSFSVFTGEKICIRKNWKNQVSFRNCLNCTIEIWPTEC